MEICKSSRRHCAVITTFNNEEETEGLIASFKAGFLVFDCILIVDDCSTTAFAFLGTETFKKQHPNVVFLQLPENFGGPGRSRNVGLKYATNKKFDLVTFIDPDDRLDKKFTQELTRLLNKYNDVQIFSFSVQRTRKNELTSWRDRRIFLKSFKYFNPLTLSGLTIRLDSFKYMEFSEKTSDIAVEDYKFYLDAIVNGNNIVQSQLELVSYGAVGDHLSKNKWKMLRKFSVVNLETFGKKRALIRLIVFVIRGFFKHRIQECLSGFR